MRSRARRYRPTSLRSMTPARPPARGACPRAGERSVNASRIREMVERARLVEARHLHRPFHRRSATVERQPAVGFARDRHDTAVDFRRIGAVDLKLGLAGRLALLDRGEIEKGKPHRALDFEHALAAEEYYGRVGIDALDAP